MVLSYRVDNDERLAMLRTTITRLDRDLGGSAVTVRVRDASPSPWDERTAALWRATRLRVNVVAAEERLLDAYRTLLADVATPAFCLQFDDILTVGLAEPWLRAADAVLAEGLADAVCPPQLGAVRLVPEHRRVEVVPFERRGDRYRFAIGGWQRPDRVVVRGGHRFGIFRTVMWGFYFNNLAAPVGDYLRRLEWYRQHVSDASVHDIELAAYEWRGPVWDRVAIPLDGVCHLDMDYAHTAAAIRGDLPDQRAVWQAVDEGWDVIALPDEG